MKRELTEQLVLSDYTFEDTIIGHNLVTLFCKDKSVFSSQAKNLLKQKSDIISDTAFDAPPLGLEPTPIAIGALINSNKC